MPNQLRRPRSEALLALSCLVLPVQQGLPRAGGPSGPSGASGAQVSGVRPGQAPLNVLMIVLDDVGTDKLRLYDETPPAGPAGCPTVQLLPPPYPVTPRLEALARTGIVFERFYANPICMTTRACLQSGRYSSQTGFVGLTEATGPCLEPGGFTDCFKLPDSEVFLAELLRYGFPPEQAYRSGAFGKWHLTRPWNRTHAIDNGYEHFAGTITNLNSHYVWKKTLHDETGDPSVSEQTGWSASVVRADAVEWINDQNGPFFAYVAFHAPHRPWELPPFELLSDETACELFELELSSGSTGAYLPGALAVPEDPEPKIQLFYRAMLESLDAEIGNLLDGIEPGKLLNTMIFVVGDNGTLEQAISSPPHDRTHGKGSVYRLGTRVPMIVSGPVIPRAPAGGWRTDELVGAVDLWRTIAALTNADESRAFQKLGVFPAPEMASISFAGLLRSPASAGPRTWAFSQGFVPGGIVTPESTDFLDCLLAHDRAMTDGAFTYIRRQAPKENACEPRTYLADQLFEWSDSNEQFNLIDEHTGELVPDAPPGAAEALVFLREQMYLTSGD